MKKYIVIAASVFVVGLILIFGIVQYLPQLFEGGKNHHSFMDQLEKDGAPLFEEKTIDGNTFSLQSQKGKVVIISFWASWCSPCIEEFPSLVELVNKYKGKVHLVAISADYSVEDIRIFLKSQAHFDASDVSVIWDKDQKLGQIYNVNKLPESYVFGSDLKLIRKVSGSINWVQADAIEFFNRTTGVK
jgi:thiol-disulfide isomerase/thioredoxin